MNEAGNPYKDIEGALGAVLNLMATDPSYASRTLKDLHGRVLPPIVSRQHRLVRNSDGEAMAYASWARVSGKMERKITAEQERIRPSEWQSGETALLIDLAASDRKTAQSMLGRMKRELFPGVAFKARRVDPGNKTAVWAEIDDAAGN